MTRASLAFSLAALLLLAAGCTGTGSGPAARPGPPSRSASAPSGPGCPSPRQLAGGKAIAIDYVDLVVHKGVTFLNASETPNRQEVVKAADVGSVVFAVACNLLEFTRSGTVEPPGLVADSAGFLPTGTQVRSVRGYPPTCRLTAMRGGSWAVYLAQHEVNRVSATEPCALAPTSPAAALTQHPSPRRAARPSPAGPASSRP